MVRFSKVDPKLEDSFCKNCGLPKNICACHNELEKKLILIERDGRKIISSVAEIVSRSRIDSEPMMKAKIDPENYMTLYNKFRETVRLQWKEGKDYIGVFVNAGMHKSFFALPAVRIDEIINFLLKTKKKMFLNSAPPNDKER
jgi:hypothetical protein